MKNHRHDVIAVIQPFVPDYRRPLFDAIDVRLRERGLRLEVWHADPKGRVAARGNADRGPWSVPIRQRRLSIGRRNITYRNVHAEARRVAAVVAGLASTNIETYALAADPAVRLMLWGHGRNFTASNNSLDQRVEGWLTRRAQHVFTYTEGGREHVLGHGIAPSDVTVVVNATDTGRLRRAQEATSARETAELRARYKLGDSPVLLFVGAFDAPKKLPFLIAAMDEVVQSHPDALLVLAGTGPDELQVRELANTRQHIRLVGRQDAESVARLSTLAEAMAMPGRVGLVAVDALALGLPVVTTRYPYHAPEASYLTDGKDSVWTDENPSSYASGLSKLLASPELVARLKQRAQETGRTLSVEASADRFVAGIVRGLGTPSP